MRFRHLKVIDTTHGVYIDMHSLLRLLIHFNSTYPSKAMTILYRTLFDTHAEYLRARHHGTKVTDPEYSKEGIR
jgi:hypothetical protein